MDPHYMSARQLLQGLRTGKWSSVELLARCLELVERFNDVVNAVVILDAERARSRARKADRARAQGKHAGPLHGLPMTVKETFEMDGLPTTAGVASQGSYVSSRTAVAVQRLQDAGAVVFGKTNTALLAGDLQTYNSLYGVTSNPWDTERTAGGSSGGSAAALAVGMTPLELGSDIGGSIRIPAHFCGVCGHKPSHGIVPVRGHVPGPPGSLTRPDLAVVGPMARTIDDLAVALDVLAGADEPEAAGWTLRLPAARKGGRVGGYRIAAWLDDPACPVDAATADLLEGLVGRLLGTGLAVDTAARPEGINLAESHELFYRLLIGAMSPGVSRSRFRTLKEQAEITQADASDYSVRLARSVIQSHADWLRLHERRLQLGRLWARFFEKFDVLLCPVTSMPAFSHDWSEPVETRVVSTGQRTQAYLDLLIWPGLPGVAYLPATVVPVGRTPAGLPVGVQVVGPYLGDHTTLTFAREVERLCGGFVAPPGYGA